jgi:protein ImuB
LQWQCRLFSPDAEPSQVDLQLIQPASTADQVMPLVQMHLEQRGLAAAHRPRSRRQRQDFDAPFCVHHIGVSVGNSALLVDRQRLLFDEDPRLDRGELAHLIDRLSARLGAERVLGARLLADAQPESACRFEPLIGRSKERRRGMAPQTATPLQRPLRLHPPVAVQVVSAGGDGPPALVAWGNARSRVAGCWGPERIETGWWRGPTVRREYWRVELQDGRWLWLYRDLRSREWYCQGAF